MKKIKLVIILTFSLISLTGIAQEPISFEKQYMFDDKGGYIRDLKQTSDNGFICAGGIGFSMYDVRFLIFKTDSVGAIEWYKYNDRVSVNSNLLAIDITNSGGYVGIGSTQENSDWHQSGAIVLYDHNGDTIWSRQYAFNQQNNPELKSRIFFNDGLYTSDDHIVATGTISDLTSNGDPFIVKTNIQGDTIWTWRLYSPYVHVYINSIVENKEGDYVIVGESDGPLFDYNKTYASQRGVIIKVSKNGELMDIEEWTDIDFNYFTDISIDSDGNYIISGVVFQHPPEYPDDSYHGLLVKTDEDGETIFYKEIKYGKKCSGVCVTIVNENEYVYLLNYEVPDDVDEGWGLEVLLQKYNNSGEQLWERNIGGIGVTQWPYSLITTRDNGLALCGLYSVYAGGNYSWLVKTDSLGNGNYNPGWINEVVSNNFEKTIDIYPNPAYDKVNVYIEYGYDYTCLIYSLDGRIIKIVNLNSFYNQIDVNQIKNGVYLLEISDGKHRQIEKIIINH